MATVSISVLSNEGIELFPAPLLILLDKLFIFSFRWKEDFCKGGKRLQLFRFREPPLVRHEKIELLQESWKEKPG